VSEEDQQVVVQFLKALADESRLKIVGLLANGERSVDELAATLKLKPPTVSHHLAKLRAVGLVRMRSEGTTHVYTLDNEALRRMNRDLLTPAHIASIVEDNVDDAYAAKVLRAFFDGETLKEIPASRKKREVVLHWLAEQFVVGVHYPEKQVNAIIQRHHPDASALRRELVDGRWMQREDGIYWRTPESTNMKDEPTRPPIIGEAGVEWRMAHRERGET